MNHPLGAAAPVQIRAEAPTSYEQLISELAKIDLAEMTGALRMGDVLLEVESRFGPQHLKTAAHHAGIAWSSAAQRLWVSRKLPPGHPVRRMKSLNYSHLRVLAGTSDPEGWARRVEENDWSAASLLEAVQRVGDQQAQRSGVVCSQCNSPLGGLEEIVTVAVGKERRVRLCSTACGIRHLKKPRSGSEAGEQPDPWNVF